MQIIPIACAGGGSALLAVIISLLYFFIVKEARRTAIKRGLGLVMICRSDSQNEENEDGMYSVYSTRYSDLGGR